MYSHIHTRPGNRPMIYSFTSREKLLSYALLISKYSSTKRPHRASILETVQCYSGSQPMKGYCTVYRPGIFEASRVKKSGRGAEEGSGILLSAPPRAVVRLQGGKGEEGGRVWARPPRPPPPPPQTPPSHHYGHTHWCGRTWMCACVCACVWVRVSSLSVDLFVCLFVFVDCLSCIIHLPGSFGDIISV